MKRLRELDFLRGIAIILVFFRHQFLFQYTINCGWIGVDLFFVLSGFLVSGLLFKEYLEFGNINPKRFLIRRGFKIYPIYYLSYPLYIFIDYLLGHPHSNFGILSDLTFIQNYTIGWGFAYSASWSLAVEEHFYIGLSILLWIGITYKKIYFLEPNEKKGGIKFPVLVISIMVICLLLRLLTNYYSPGNMPKNFLMTHLRVDSLFAGVLISYLYYFRLDYLKANFQSNKTLLLVICFLGVCWTPFIDPEKSPFVKTFGFSFLYISFGILLSYFILANEINQKLNKIFSAKVVDIISKIGYCSYSIYIIHSLVIFVEEKIVKNFHLYDNRFLNFIINGTTSVILGMLMTFFIETYFLNLRNKFYPSRAI